jgi:soluble lytic murein transglycosylase-like protein
MARYLIAIALLAAPALACAEDCVERAAAKYRLNADLLRAIAEVESANRADAMGPLLPDGNRALGKMQVNTVHLAHLGRYGITRKDLMSECGSVFVGAWIFAQYVHLAGPTWTAVGYYNTGPKSTNYGAQARYIEKVKRHFDRIQRDKNKHPPMEQRVASVASIRRSNTDNDTGSRMTVWDSE